MQSIRWTQHSRMPPVRTPVTLVPHGSWVGALKGPIQVHRAVTTALPPTRQSLSGASPWLASSHPHHLNDAIDVMSFLKEVTPCTNRDHRKPRHASRCLDSSVFFASFTISDIVPSITPLRTPNSNSKRNGAFNVVSFLKEVTSPFSHTTVCNNKTRSSVPSRC